MLSLSLKCPENVTHICNSVSSWLATHSIITWIVITFIIIWRISVWLLDTIPQLQTLKVEVIMPYAKKREHGRRVKSATKADIESKINTAIMKFSDQLPAEWLSKMKIDWVENESKEDFFNDDEMVLRIRPLEDQTKNLVRAGYAFLQKAFFPRARNVVPKEHREAAVLFTGNKIMAHQGNEVLRMYEDVVLEPAINRNRRVLPVMERYKTLDSKGFFMGAFLREVQAIAIGARFDPIRNRMREEISSMLTHMEDFMLCHPRQIPDMLWSRQGPITNYCFLLVALRTNVETGNISVFVNRARENLTRGIDRLYIFGAEENRNFTTRVINAIGHEITEYKIVERFNLSNDFRAQPGGLGALLVRKTTLS